MISRTKLKVRYAETDQMGVVHHATYLVWFEAARIDFLDVAELAYREVERRGIFLPVIEAKATFRRPAHFGDSVLIHTRIGDLRSRGVRFEYEVEREEGELLLARGYTEHVAVDLDRHSVPIPGFLKERLEWARQH